MYSIATRRAQTPPPLSGSPAWSRAQTPRDSSHRTSSRLVPTDGTGSLTYARALAAAGSDTHRGRSAVLVAAIAVADTARIRFQPTMDT